SSDRGASARSSASETRSAPASLQSVPMLGFARPCSMATSIPLLISLRLTSASNDRFRALRRSATRRAINPLTSSPGTELAVSGIDRAPGSLPDVAPALHQTATFRAADDATFLEMATTPRHDSYYTRDGNPTVSDVESLIAALEGADSCLLTASGMGAISTAVLGLVCQG